MHAVKLGELFQEAVQGQNNEHEGAALMELSKGSSLFLLADPSALNNDLYGGYGVSKQHFRLFSVMMGKATHDERQYTKETTPSAKKSKYALDDRITP